MNAVLEDTFRPLSVIHDAPTRVYEDPHQPVGEPPSSRAALLRLPKHAQDRWSSSLDEELGALGIKNVFGPSVSYGEREPGVPVIHTNTIFTKKAPTTRAGFDSRPASWRWETRSRSTQRSAQPRRRSYRRWSRSWQRWDSHASSRSAARTCRRVLPL
jgi:hypothetical protein